MFPSHFLNFTAILFQRRFTKLKSFELSVINDGKKIEISDPYIKSKQGANFVTNNVCNKMRQVRILY